MDAQWWCTPCAAWVRAKRLGSVGPMCKVCGSGRVRPPHPGEGDAARAASLPPLSPEAVKAELDS